MNKLLWCTDIHLNFVRHPHRFGKYLLSEHKFDAVVVTGDIAEAKSLHSLLIAFASTLEDRPIYFCLGNHDFYGSSLPKVRNGLKDFCDNFPQFHYLTQQDAVELSPTTALVGDDGWYDAKAGDYENSKVYLSDFDLVKELHDTLISTSGLSREAVFSRGDRKPLINRCRKLALMSAQRLEPKLRAVASKKYSRVFIATHVPPYRESCWHKGQVSDDQWLPWFANVTMGEMFTRVFNDFPDIKFTVLCGHSHSGGTHKPTANSEVITGAAQYGAPDLVKVFD